VIDDDDMMMMVMIMTTTTMIEIGVHDENSLHGVISGFRRGVNEIFALLECYAA
jgi:hypothetical protein